MTAYVSIEVAKHDDVLLAPNAALRYKPKLDDADTGKPSVAKLQPQTPPQQGQGKGQGRKKKSGQDNTSSGTVYILKNGKLEAEKVRVGISDGRFTEISSKILKTGDKVVVGENQEDASSTAGSGNMRMRMF